MKNFALVALAALSLALTGCAIDIKDSPSYALGVSWAQTLVDAGGMELSKNTMVGLYDTIENACTEVVAVQVPKVATGSDSDAWIAGCISVFK